MIPERIIFVSPGICVCVYIYIYGFLLPPSVSVIIGCFGIFKFVDEAVHISYYMAPNDMTGDDAEWFHTDITTIYNDIIWDIEGKTMK